MNKGASNEAGFCSFHVNMSVQVKFELSCADCRLGGDGGIRTLDTLFKVCSFSKRVPSAARPRLHRPDMPHAMTHRKSLSAFIVSSIDWFFVRKAPQPL